MKAFKSTTIVAKLENAFVARQQALIAEGKHVAAEFGMVFDNVSPGKPDYRSFVAAVDNIKNVFDFSFLMRIAHNHAFGNSHNAQYLQMKTVEKIVKFVRAFGFKDFRAFDVHTKNILMHVMINNGVIRSRTAFAVLTKCELSELDIVDDKRDRAFMSKYSAGTGSAQMSSTKECFRVMGVTNGIKGERDAPIVFTEDAKRAFVEYFSIVSDKVRAYSPDADAPAAADADAADAAADADADAADAAADADADADADAAAADADAPADVIE